MGLTANGDYPVLWIAQTDRRLSSQGLGVLSPEEKTRGQGFGRPADQQRYWAVRVMLRGVLARYLNASPAAVKFCYGPQGKPLIAHPPSGLAFNVSHSGSYALISVAIGGRVGVDIEQMNPEVAVLPIARRFFAPEEVNGLEQSPASEVLTQFYQRWTAKEAFLKALGVGLGGGLHRVVPSLDPPSFIQLPDTEQNRPWQLALGPWERHYRWAIAWESEQPLPPDFQPQWLDLDTLGGLFS